MKKLVSILLIVVMLSMLSVNVFAKDVYDKNSGKTYTVYQGTIYIDGDKMLSKYGEALIDENDRTLVPIRAFSESMWEVDVEWDNNTQTAIITEMGSCKGPGGYRIKIKIGSKTINRSFGIVNNSTLKYSETDKQKPIYMDTTARLINDRTYIPLRFAAEAFGRKVIWDEKTKDITIKY